MQVMVAASFSIRYRSVLVANIVWPRGHLKTLLGEKTLLGMRPLVHGLFASTLVHIIISFGGCEHAQNKSFPWNFGESHTEAQRTSIRKQCTPVTPPFTWLRKLRYTFYILRDKLVEGIVNKNSTKIIFSFFGLSRATSATHAGTRDYDWDTMVVGVS